MRPIRFSSTATVPIAIDQIADRILDLSQWPDFTGYGPLPGIESAEFLTKTPEIVDSRIRVVNTDGSSHEEQVTSWLPTERIELTMSGFSPPLAQLATSFDERWEFQPDGDRTRVTRSFQLHPRSPARRPLLWLISLLLRRAVDRHVRQMGF